MKFGFPDLTKWETDALLIRPSRLVKMSLARPDKGKIWFVSLHDLWSGGNGRLQHPYAPRVGIEPTAFICTE